jgi:hypothetical protein
MVKLPVLRFRTRLDQEVWELAERDDGEHGREHEQVNLIVEEGIVRHAGETLQGGGVRTLQGLLAVWEGCPKKVLSWGWEVVGSRREGEHRGGRK